MSDEKRPPGNPPLRLNRPNQMVRRARAVAQEIFGAEGDAPNARPLQPTSTRPEANVATTGEPASPGLPTTDLASPMQMLLAARAQRKRRFMIRIGLFCILPTVITFLYMIIIASPRYTSEFEITYQTYSPPTSTTTGLVQNFLGASGGSTVDPSQILYEYIRSASLMEKVDQQVGLRKYLSDNNVDFFARMSPSANLDTFLRYYLWHISVEEGSGGYLTVDVEAYDQKMATAVAKAIIKDCDEMVDQMTGPARNNEVKTAETLVQQAEQRVLKAREALTEFQNKYGDLDPQSSANQLTGIVGSIESQLSTQRANLSALEAGAPRSPQVRATQLAIGSLEQQLRSEQGRLASSTGNGAFSNLLNQYSALELEQDFAKNSYLAAQQGLSVARADAATKQNYLIDFAPPYTPPNSSLLNALLDALTVLLSTLVLFGIVSLMAGAIRDQSGT
jgi:capsular polysaccharide transport system permease protein